MLDLSDPNNHAVDTIIFAGENGCGKTSIMEALYDFSEFKLVSDNDHVPKSMTVTYQLSSEQLTYISQYLTGAAAYIKDAINGVINIKYIGTAKF